MGNLRGVRRVVAVGLLLAASCYNGGESLDLDLGQLERRELRAGDLVLIAWVATEDDHHRKGLAIVEKDRLQPGDDHRRPAMLYDVRDPASTPPPFHLRMQPMDIAVLSRDGTVLMTTTLPRRPMLTEESGYILETLGGTWDAGGVGPGTRFAGLADAPR